MSAQFIERYSRPDTKGLFLVVTGNLDDGDILNFEELEALKEEVDRLFSEEQNRILMESLSGDLVCDSCNI